MKGQVKLALFILRKTVLTEWVKQSILYYDSKQLLGYHYSRSISYEKAILCGARDRSEYI